MLNYIGIDKLHGLIMHSIMLAVGRILRESDYSFQFSNVGSYGNMQYSVPKIGKYYPVNEAVHH